MGFINYDVNERGDIVFSSKDGDTNIVHIYLHEGKYRGSFESKERGRIYVEWIDCEFLRIYLDGGYVMLTIDSDREMIIYGYDLYMKGN